MFYVYFEKKQKTGISLGTPNEDPVFWVTFNLDL